MQRRDLLAASAALCIPGLGMALRAAADAQDDVDAASVPAPRGAVVLFDGKDLSKWVNRKDDKPAGWKVEDGRVEVVPGNGDIHTADSFGDFRLHVEFWVPLMPQATGQARGNSGVYL